MLPKVKLFNEDGFHFSKVTIGDQTVMTAIWKQDGQVYGDWSLIDGECDENREKNLISILKDRVKKDPGATLPEINNLPSDEA